MSSSACDFTCCTCSTIGAGSAHSRAPARTSTACATASVSGSVSTNFVPPPFADVTSTRPPSAPISLRTTSMPMPRPEICVTFDAVRESRREQVLDELRLGRRRVGSDEAQRPRALFARARS